MGNLETLTTVIPEEYAGRRLDQALANLFDDHSRARLQHWIREGNVLLDNKIVNQRYRVRGGECVQITTVHKMQICSQAENIPLDIVYEDEHVLVLNKPAGLVVHPGAGNPHRTLLNALLHHCPDINIVTRAGIVHRLDKDTTGLMIIAKTPESHTHLVEAMQSREIYRCYLALVRGELIAGGTVDQPIGRHPTKRVKMAVRASGKPARTHYRIEERLRGFTLLRCRLESGRTHQIRVHMAKVKHPIVGDPIYGGRFSLPGGFPETVHEAIGNFKRQALHAFRLQLMHPMKNCPMDWQVPLPNDFSSLLQAIRSYA